MRTILASTAAAYVIVMAAPAMAQTRSFNVPEQAASTGIPELARQADIQILISEGAARGKTTRAVKGNMSVEAALQRLLRGTGLRISSSDGRTISLVAGPGAAAATSGEAVAGSAAAEIGSADIVVTGTRVVGGETASPTTVLRSDQIRLAGQTGLGEAMRTLPQNFSGGQNPGVASGVIGITNQNLNSGSSPNLRGLGADATLTLLNGHRLSYGSFVQAVDISAIPLAAVDRVEIVPDGASAIYGSDAVGGVVNVILKSNYDGLSMLASVGGASDGGYFKQQYSAVAGRTRSTGNFMVAYSHDKNSAIFAHDRDFTSYMPEGNTLFPDIAQNSILISARQSIGPIVDFSLDATYNDRTSFSSQETTSGYIYQNTPRTKDFSVSPSLRIDLSASWDLRVSGTYGRSRTYFDQATIYQGANTARTRGCYCNELASVEAYASGPLATFNGNSFKMVLGGRIPL